MCAGESSPERVNTQRNEMFYLRKSWAFQELHFTVTEGLSLLHSYHKEVNKSSGAILSTVHHCLQIMDTGFFSPRYDPLFQQNPSPKFLRKINVCSGIGDSISGGYKWRGLKRFRQWLATFGGF
jgi:hypothetical protein